MFGSIEKQNSLQIQAIFQIQLLFQNGYSARIIKLTRIFDRLQGVQYYILFWIWREGYSLQNN